MLIASKAAYNLLKTSCIVEGLSMGWNSFLAKLETKPVEKLMYKIITKSPTEFRSPEPLLIVNCCRLFQGPALLAAILLLAVVLIRFIFKAIF